MISRSFPLLVLSLGVSACAGLFLAAALPAARAQTPPPLDPASVLATLKELKGKQAEVINREKSGVLAAINAAIGDPGRAYEQAIMAVDIQGGSNEGGRSAEWRKHNGAQLHERDFLEAVRLHLTWLALTWQHGMGVKVRDQMPSLLNYTSQVTNDGDPILTFEALKRPVTQGLFATYFQVGPFLTHTDDWEEQPFEVDNIFRKTILPAMRADKDPRLLDYWNGRIQAESARANSSQNGLAANKARNVKLPGLFFERADDEFALGMANQAVADMMALIKAHPDHPDFDRWINRVTEIVSPPKGEVIVGPPTATTP